MVLVTLLYLLRPGVLMSQTKGPSLSLDHKMPNIRCFFHKYVCVCACVRERERERGRDFLFIDGLLQVEESFLDR